MQSCAPCGSYTPGANTNGSLSSSSRSRVAGSIDRDAGTWKPGGRSSVSVSSLVSSVVMVHRARVRAFALQLAPEEPATLALGFDPLLDLGHVVLQCGRAVSFPHARRVWHSPCQSAHKSNC